MRWRVLFYVKDNGERPVEEFLRKLPPGHQGKAIRAIDLRRRNKKRKIFRIVGAENTVRRRCVPNFLFSAQ